MQSQVPFPLIPVASTFSPDNMMVKDLRGLILFFVSSVDTLTPSAKGLHGDILVRSSKQSARQAGVTPIDPLQRYTDADFAESGIPLVAIVQGQFQSGFSGKPVP